MKVELKQIVLLPAHRIEVVNEMSEVSSISFIDFDNKIIALKSGFHFEFDDLGNGIFLILRPFSSLTRETNYGGRKFVPIIEFIKQNFKVDDKHKLEIFNVSQDSIKVGYSGKVNNIYWEVPIHKDSISYKLLNYCLSMQIDMFGFIDSKLAVDYDMFNNVPS